MSELEPLLDSSDNTHARALLRAGRSDAPPSGFSDSLLVGLGLSSTGVTAVASAATARAAVHGSVSLGGAGSPALALVAAKWLAIGLLGGGILCGGAQVVWPSARSAVVIATRQSAAGPRLESSTASPRPQSDDAPRASPIEPTAARVLERPHASTSAAPPPAQSGQLGREVRAIDAARGALAAGDIGRAVTDLDAYEHIATTGVLDREAQVLRIETFYKMGRTPLALALSEQYLRSFPSDAHAARLRALEAAASSH